MTTHRRRRRAALIALALGAASLGLAPSPVAAAECPQQLPSCIVVSVVSTSGGQTTVLTEYTVAPADLQPLTDEALNAKPYALRKNPASKGGTIDTRPIAQGQRVTVNKLLKTLDPNLPGTATYLETPNAAGVPAVLSPADLADPDAPDDADGDGQPDTSYPFADRLAPVVFVTPSGRLGYIRPLRDADEDTNASDYFQVTGRLDLTVHTTGSLLAPTVTSSNGTELDIDGRTTFSVTFAEKPRTRVISTTWDFGDGSVKGTKREKPSKSYTKRGTYAVAVAVRTSDGSYGRSAPVEVKVAKPPKAPTSGAGGGDGIGGGGGLPAPYDPFDGGLDDLEDVPEDLPSEDVPEDVPPAPVDDGLEPVEGYVLAGAELVPGGTPESIPGTQSSTTPAPATQASTRQRIATWTVAALAVLLLVGVGAASESRWIRHRLRHLRRAA